MPQTVIITADVLASSSHGFPPVSRTVSSAEETAAVDEGSEGDAAEEGLDGTGGSDVDVPAGGGGGDGAGDRASDEGALTGDGDESTRIDPDADAKGAAGATNGSSRAGDPSDAATPSPPVVDAPTTPPPPDALHRLLAAGHLSRFDAELRRAGVSTCVRATRVPPPPSPPRSTCLSSRLARSRR